MPGADLLLWMPWALLLSAAAAYVGVRGWRRGEHAAALGWVGWALVPPALLLTGTLRLLGRVSGAVLDWSASLVFTPTTWVGIALAGAAAVLITGARLITGSRLSTGARAVGRRKRPGGPAAVEPPAAEPGRIDDELADVQEILRRRGIS